MSRFVSTIPVAFVIFCSQVFAATGSPRTEDKLGLYAGFLGDPHPSSVGGNIGLNVTDFLRVTGGSGKVSSGPVTLTAYAFGCRGLVPGWEISPAFGFSIASVNLDRSDLDPTLVGEVQGFSTSGSHLYLTLAVDWQTSLGLYLGAGINVSAGPGGALPFVDVGWFL